MMWHFPSTFKPVTGWTVFFQAGGLESGRIEKTKLDMV